MSERGGLTRGRWWSGGLGMTGLLLAGGMALAQPAPAPPGLGPNGPPRAGGQAGPGGMHNGMPHGMQAGRPPGMMPNGMSGGPMPMAGGPMPPSGATGPGPAGPLGLGLAGALAQAPGVVAAAEASTNYPVFAITGVEVLRSAHSPGVDVVLAQGVTSSEGWEHATLVPLTSGAPADGVLDMVMVAGPPERTMAPSGWAPIQAVLPVSDHPFKAIRVRGATNAVTLETVPGYAEAKPPVDPCGACVGKLLVAKGAAPPSGTPAADVVREEDLPAGTRIIRPTDGIGDMRGNPNRLTLVVGADGKIIDAAWE